MKNKRRPIYIEWKDATTKSGWHQNGDCGLIEVVTLGWLMWEDEEQITVCCSRETTNDDGMISSNTIPKAWIQKRKWVTL